MEWWIGYILSIVLILVGGFFSLILLVMLLGYFLLPAEERPGGRDISLAAALSSLLIFGLVGFFTLRSGKREYEKLKRKRENQGQS